MNEANRPPVIRGDSCHRLGRDVGVRVREVTMRSCPHCGTSLRAWSCELGDDGVTVTGYRLRPVIIELAAETKNGLQRDEIVAWRSYDKGVTQEWFGQGHPFLGGWLTCARGCVVHPTVEDAEWRQLRYDGEPPLL